MMALIADFGAFAGRMSPITPEGLLVRELLATGGISATMSSDEFKMGKKITLLG